MISAIQTRYNTIFDATIGRLWISRLWDGIDRDMPATRPMLSRPDILLAFGLGLVGMAVSLWGFAQTNRVPAIHTMFDLWFDADIARVAENMVTTTGEHARTSVHPLFSILVYPFGKLLTVLGVDPLAAAKALVVLVMGANAALFSLTTRLLGLPRSVGVLFTLLFMTTASFLFWSAVVETYPFSCFAVMMSLFMMLRVKTAHWGWWLLVNVLTLGFLVTNWIFALIAMAVRLKLKPFVAIAVTSFSLVVVLSVIQNATFEKAALFFNPETLVREAHHTQPGMESRGVLEEGWRPASNLRNIYVTTVVGMPVYVKHAYRRLVTTNQHSGFPDGEVSPVIAVVAWVVLFGMGLWGALSRKDIRLPLIGAALMLLMQSALHTIYGPVTFLYNLSFMPLLILFACLAWYAPYRKIAVAMACTVVVFGGINNERRMQETVNVAGCLSEFEAVKERHTWELIRNQPTPEPSESSTLDIDTVNLCNTKTPS